jgi:hypothetical protein
MIHTSGFCGEDAGVVKLNVVSHVDTMIRHGDMSVEIAVH